MQWRQNALLEQWIFPLPLLRISGICQRRECLVCTYITHTSYIEYMTCIWQQTVCRPHIQCIRTRRLSCSPNKPETMSTTRVVVIRFWVHWWSRWPDRWHGMPSVVLSRWHTYSSIYSVCTDWHVCRTTDRTANIHSTVMQLFKMSFDLPTWLRLYLNCADYK